VIDNTLSLITSPKIGLFNIRALSEVMIPDILIPL